MRTRERRRSVSMALALVCAMATAGVVSSSAPATAAPPGHARSRTRLESDWRAARPRRERATASTQPSVPGSPQLDVGTQTLVRCGSSPLAYCGHLAVPLDYVHPDGVEIKVAYRWYPAVDPGPTQGTVMPVEGGPGYPSIGSVGCCYRPMYGPLLEHWNLLAVDLRGTGSSTALDCPALQNFKGQASGTAFRLVVGSCGTSLDHRWRTSSGNWVDASDLFTSAAAAEDVAAVVRALDAGPVDLYGDSYGSFFAQVFASRYPTLVRSVVLDSTYAILDLDPWYRSTIQSMPADFDEACSRSPACADAAPGSSWARIGALAARLRRAPVEGTVPGPDGSREKVTMGVVGLVDLVNDAAEDPLMYRGLDASARALLDSDDPAPLLRLYAQRLASDEAYFGIPASSYSGGLYFAVSCLDYPQLFDMTVPTSIRLEQLAAAEASLPSSTFAPFTTAEWLGQDENTEAYTACASWPAPVDAQPPTMDAPPLLPADLPVLILGGEFDTWTPPSGVPQVMGELGANTRFVELANATHVVGEGDTTCGSELVRQFVASPSALWHLDVSCAAAVPPIDTVGVYAASIGQQPPLSAGPGNDAPLIALRAAAVAVATVGDARSRSEAIDASLDHGLYGGTVRVEDDGALLELSRDQLVRGVPVSGDVRVRQSAVTAAVDVAVPGLGQARLTIRWNPSVADPLALVTGDAVGDAVVGSTWAS
jgi:pimeloyl-ACP methyl ester carboxylesterase